MAINFGWIGKDGLEKRENFYEYVKEDVKRNINRIEKCIKDDKIIDEIKEKSNKALEEIKEINLIKPVISWYDINPNNILVDNSCYISGFLDAGGARFAPKEWDIAFIKMDLCKNEKEFSTFLENYSKNNQLNEKLLNALTIIVELDDIAFELENKVKLPIAFNSNFRDIIVELQNKY